MITRIRHKGLRVLHEEGDGGEFSPSRARKLAEILLVLDGASDVDDLRARGYRVYRAGPRGAGDWASRSQPTDGCCSDSTAPT